MRLELFAGEIYKVLQIALLDCTIEIAHRTSIALSFLIVSWIGLKGM